MTTYTNKIGKTFELVDVKVGDRFLHTVQSPYVDGDIRNTRLTTLIIEVTKVEGCGADWKTVEVLSDLYKPSWSVKEKGLFISQGGFSTIKGIFNPVRFRRIGAH